MESGSLTFLISLDLSAAFDLVSHDVLLSRLQHTFGIVEPALSLSLIRSFLSPPTMVVNYNNATSPAINCIVGVPQGSVLGPILFSCYVAPVTTIPDKFNISYHYYADDLLLICKLDRHYPHRTLGCIEECLLAISTWFGCNQMGINPEKTECLLVGTPQTVAKYQDSLVLNFAGSTIKPGT
jgi:hypothetical protein